MQFGEAVTSNLRNYANFSGSASRSEFWWFFLFCILVTLVAGVLDGVIGGTSRSKPIFTTLSGIALLLPSAGITWRRTADVGLPGWISLFPTIVGSIYFLALAGSLMENKPITEDEELGWGLIMLVCYAPFIFIWCLPSKVK